MRYTPENVNQHPRPNLDPASVLIFGYICIIVAELFSLSLNVYYEVHAHTSALPHVLGWFTGVVPPILAGGGLHFAISAHIEKIRRYVLLGLCAVMMYVSAHAGVKVLMPADSTWPSVCLSVGADAFVMVIVSVIMDGRERAKAAAEWDRAKAEADRLDRVGAFNAQFAGVAVGRGTVPGNSTAVEPGNGDGNGGGNGLGAAGGSGRPLPPGNGKAPLALSAADPEAGNTAAGDGLATVTTMKSTRPSLTPDEMLERAYEMAEALAPEGTEISVRRYRSAHGGNTERVMTIVAQVSADYGPVVRAVKSAMRANPGLSGPERVAIAEDVKRERGIGRRPAGLAAGAR